MKVAFFSQDNQIDELMRNAQNISSIFTDDLNLIEQFIEDSGGKILLFLDFDIENSESVKLNEKFVDYDEVIRIVMTSSMPLKELRKHQFSSAGAHGYLRKPIDIEIINNILNDFELSDYVSENDLTTEGSELDPPELTFIGIKNPFLEDKENGAGRIEVTLDEQDSTDEINIEFNEIRIDDEVHNMLQQHGLVGDKKFDFNSLLNLEIQEKFDQVFGEHQEDVMAKALDEQADEQIEPTVLMELPSADEIAVDFENVDEGSVEDVEEEVLSMSDDKNEDSSLEFSLPNESQDIELNFDYQNEAEDVDTHEEDFSDNNTNDADDLILGPNDEEEFSIENDTNEEEDAEGLSFALDEEEDDIPDNLDDFLATPEDGEEPNDFSLSDDSEEEDDLYGDSENEDLSFGEENLVEAGADVPEEAISLEQEDHEDVDLEFGVEETPIASENKEEFKEFDYTKTRESVQETESDHLDINLEMQEEVGEQTDPTIMLADITKDALNIEEEIKAEPQASFEIEPQASFEIEQEAPIEESLEQEVAITPSEQRISSLQNDDELLRNQATIRQLREERENLLAEINKLKAQVEIVDQDNLGLRAELDEAKIEITILKKRHYAEIDELKYQLRLSHEKKDIFEERSKNYQKEFERLNQKVRIDFNQVKQREKDLESQLELAKMDSESQVKSRDSKILELKRKIDALEFNMENASIREQKSKEDKVRLEERLAKMMRTLRGSIKHLEDDLDLDDEVNTRLGKD